MDLLSGLCVGVIASMFIGMIVCIGYTATREGETDER